MTKDEPAPGGHTLQRDSDATMPLHRGTGIAGLAAGILNAFMWVLLATLPGTLTAQAPAPSRLEQLETTYTAVLRTLHSPVLQDYLRQLELLKTQLSARGRPEDAKLVDAEIARVKTISSTTGVMPYTALQPPAPDTTTEPSPAPASAATTPADKPGTLPTLLAAEAFKGGDLHPKTGAVPIGSAEWRIFGLPAGTYDLLMVFASESMDAPEAVTLRIGGQEVKATVPPERATGSVETFRLVRLCQITLHADVAAGSLAIESASSAPRLWIRKLVFAKPRPPRPPKT